MLSCTNHVQHIVNTQSLPHQVLLVLVLVAEQILLAVITLLPVCYLATAALLHHRDNRTQRRQTLIISSLLQPSVQLMLRIIRTGKTAAWKVYRPTCKVIIQYWKNWYKRSWCIRSCHIFTCISFVILH